MASVIYALCALTSGLCAVLLWRAYRASRARLLLWSSLSFIGLACNNLLLFVDLIIVPSVDLALYRSLLAAVSVMVLLLGLIWDSN
jgi:hydrogenase/urease accessory protein HupE